jgi:uncharacterized protein (TIGR03435 family)
MDLSKRAVLGILVLGLALAEAVGQELRPMAKEAHPTFEVATVKPTPPEEHSQGFQTRGTHIKLVRETVLSMVMFAYGVHKKQVIDAPAWMTEQAWDVDGIPDVPGEPNVKQFQELVQKLLADRFGLKMHHEKREMGYYALRVAEGGPKLTKSASPEDTSPDETGNGDAKGMTMRCTNNNLDDFTLMMEYFLDRPPVNETGIKGRYDFTLKWTPDTMKVADPDTDALPGMFTALKEQLGLKLEPAKGLVDVLVVDAVARPSAN